jgi:hypothetical protein
VHFYLVRMAHYFDSIKIALVCSAIMVLSSPMRNCLLMLDFPYQRVPIGATHAVIASKASVFSVTARGWLEEAMGENTREALKLRFDNPLRLAFHGAGSPQTRGCWSVGNWTGHWD